MANSWDVHIKLSRADFSSLGLGDKHFRIVADLGDVFEVCHDEGGHRGEEFREFLDANSIVYLGSHGTGYDHGCADFASGGERCLEHATNPDGFYVVPAYREGNIDPGNPSLLTEYIDFRGTVAAKLGLCSCCDLSPEKCRTLAEIEPPGR